MKFGIPSLLKRRWFQFVLVLLVIFGGYFYWQNSQKQATAETTYVVQAKDLKQYVTTSGKITAQKQASVRFQTGGMLSWVGVKKGDMVKQWQALASLDQRELEKNLKKSLLAYSNQRADFDEMTMETYNDDVLDETIKRILQKNQNNLDSAVVNVELADLAKQYATIYSPIDGVVVKATDEYAGVNASATTEYVIVDPATLRFSAEVEELDIGKIKVGDSASIYLDAFPEATISSTISAIEFTPTKTTSGNTAYLAHFALALDSRYRLDMNGDVQILTNQRSQVLSVPIDAVIEKDGAKFVTVKRDSKKEEVSIETGLETDEEYEVIQGLQPGDTIIIPE